LHMIEIANSARSPWTAYGDRYNNASLSPLARHWAWPLGICNAKVGIVARTELGSWDPSFWSITKFGGEVYSGSRAQMSIHCSFLGIPISDVFSMLSFTALDEALPVGTESQFQGDAASGLLATILATIFSGDFQAAAADAAAGAAIPSYLDRRITWISPYVYFAPSTKVGPSGGTNAVATGLGNFGQPDVIFGLARQRADFNRNQQVFGSQFKNIIGGATNAGEVDFTYNGNDWPTVPGLNGFFQLHEGFNALCAAQTYYHRPGDWKEMPNFFNPLWSARLMPFMESNAAVAARVSTIPVLQQNLLH